jgi:hypothetical protein
MPPTTDFENHLFISYAHFDNEHLSAVEKGWIDLFHEGLEQRLKQLLGRTVKIFRDPKLRGLEDFNDVIANELHRSAVLVSIVSPRYLESESCMKELNGFYEYANRQGTYRRGSRTRLVKAIKTFVPLEKQPDTLKELLGYEFYFFDSAKDSFREYDYLVLRDGERDKRFWDKTEDIAQDITRLLKDLEGNPPPTPSGFTVYLAETTIDLREERDKVRRELQQQGHVVLPDGPLPPKPEALQEAIREMLSRSQLSLHMVGGFYDTLVRVQHNLAIEREKQLSFSRLIWLPTGLEPLDPSQVSFIGELQNTFSTTNGSELLQTKLEDLKTTIDRKLRPPIKAEPASEADVDTAKPSVYLIYDAVDREAARPLFNFLQEKCRVKIPLTKGDSATIRQDRKDKLMNCDAVIIFYGSVSDDWWQTQLDELRKVRGYGRTKPLLRAVYLASPQTEEKDMFDSVDPLVIRNFAQFASDDLKEFLTWAGELRGGRQ